MAKSAFLTIAFNLIVAISCFLIAASYYAPGNPQRPDRLDMSLMTLFSVSIGVSQLIYIIPAVWWAFRSQQKETAIGILIGAIATGLLNAVLVGSLYGHI